MIVKTSNNISAYNNLFDRANKALGYTDSSNNRISNIDDYFANIEELIGTNDPVLTILPADEEFFHIDANTRQIKIPKSFSTGASVVGDESAEIIYFDIDRYFDIQDLSKTKIFVQCQTPSGKKYLCDVINQTTKFPNSDKLVFGWPLTYELTEDAGNLQFAIRFYMRRGDVDGDMAGDQNELVYSFSTLTHTIKINSTLRFDLPIMNEQGQDEISEVIKKINKNDMIFGRIRNSLPGGVLPVIAPRFSLLTVSGDQPITTNSGLSQIVEINNKLYAKADYDSALIKSIIANGTGQIGGILEYEWGKVPFNSSEVEILNNGISDKYFLTTDNVYNAQDFYYEKINDKYESCYVDESSFAENKAHLYERFSELNVSDTGAGTYQVRAIGKATINENDDKTIKASSDWIYYIVPGPSQLILVINSEAKILGKNPRIDSTQTFVQDGGKETGSITYQWMRSIDENSDGEPITGATQSFIEPEAEGYYYLTGRHTINSDFIDSRSDNKIWITNPPREIESVSITIDGGRFGPGSFLTAAVNFAESGAGLYEDNEALLYEWYNAANENEPIQTGGNTLHWQNGFGGNEYYCKVINTLNGANSTAKNSDIIVAYNN